MNPERQTMRIAAVGDIHVGKSSQGAMQPYFSQVNDIADVLLLLGDLTNYGLPEEFKVLVKELNSVKLPIIGILGNHDVETDNEAEGVQMLTDAGVIMLDGDSYELHGVGFAGTKGFAGGFGRRSLAPWGEKIIKAFVHEAIEEALKLESALARLRTEQKVVLLHYSPIQATVMNEPLEIVPFLGSSRLEEPIDRFRASVVFHGHAHHGSPSGETKSGVPVFNVAMPLLKEFFPDAPPFKLYEVPVPATAANTPATRDEQMAHG